MPTNDPITAAIEPVVQQLLTQPTNAASWYAINAKQDANETEISIHDAIGAWGIRAERFVSDLKAIKSPVINLRLNTPGGEVFDATAIYNALQEHAARIVVHVDGVAASAGSFIAMAGDEIRMADNSYMMIHNARGGVMGEASDMRRYADVLEKMNDNIAGMYERKTGKSRDHWRGLMDAETWFTATEAKAEGLADAVVQASPSTGKAKASFDFTIYNKIPDAVRGMWGLPTQQINAPENSTTLVEPPPAEPPKQEPSMADTSNATPVAPAQTPAAGPSVVQGNPIAELNRATIEAYIAKGRSLGFEEGKQAEQTRMRDILAAAPNRPDIAVNSFLAGQNAQTVALIANAAAQAEAKAQAVMQEKEVEIARLNALVATGGHPGVNLGVAGIETSSAPEGLEPEAQAEMEWETNPLTRAKNGGESGKKRWLLYRVNELKGAVRILRK